VSTAAPPVTTPFQWRGSDGVTWLEASLPSAVAAFSTRLGGVSEGAYAQLNLGVLTQDDPGLVDRNRILTAAALEREPDGFAMGLQVHGANVQVHRDRPKPSPYTTRGVDLLEADAQLTNHPAVTPLVLVADCVPLMLSAPGAVGAVHCGWRGVTAGMVPSAVRSLCDLAGIRASSVAAALGPGIGPCCYEVGEEVAAAFGRRGLREAIEGRNLDLPQAIRSELASAGVDPEAIADLGLCTSCNPELFFSHRRDGGITGRQAGLVWLK
jgi:purine-nucleoside/S-methyl-5'-thioadenosine phosphorylase / adenosine deaminase